MELGLGRALPAVAPCRRVAQHEGVQSPPGSVGHRLPRFRGCIRRPTGTPWGLGAVSGLVLSVIHSEHGSVHLRVSIRVRVRMTARDCVSFRIRDEG